MACVCVLNEQKQNFWFKTSSNGTSMPFTLAAVNTYRATRTAVGVRKKKQRLHASAISACIAATFLLLASAIDAFLLLLFLVVVAAVSTLWNTSQPTPTWTIEEELKSAETEQETHRCLRCLNISTWRPDKLTNCKKRNDSIFLEKLTNCVPRSAPD